MLDLDSKAGTISTEPKGLVHSNTLNTAVAAPTDERGFVLSKFGAVRHIGGVLQSFGQGALVRKAGGVAVFTFETPCPPHARSNADGGFQSHTGAETMQTQTTPKAATTGNTPTVIYSNTIERHTQIENSLSTALHLVRHGKTIADIQRAMSRAMRATSLLKQTCECVDVLKGGAA